MQAQAQQQAMIQKLLDQAEASGQWLETKDYLKSSAGYTEIPESELEVQAAKMRPGASTLDRINLDPGVSTLEIEIDMVNPMSRSHYPEEKAQQTLMKQQPEREESKNSMLFNGTYLGANVTVEVIPTAELTSADLRRWTGITERVRINALDCLRSPPPPSRAHL